MASRQTAVVLALGTGQTIAWASSYYLPAIIADPIAHDLGVSNTDVFAAFSAALLLSAGLGPTIGRAIDRKGGRDVLCLSNLVFASGLILLAAAHGLVSLGVAWLVLGVGMALGLYDSAFATLAGIYGRNARSAITGITLIAGFASTIGWPLTSLLDQEIGWRGACLSWAGLHLLLALPLNRFLVPQAAPPARETAVSPDPHTNSAPRGAMALLAFVFAATWVVSTGMAAHLPSLLEAAGASKAAAITAAALVGPAQVAARLIEFSLLRRLHPLASARLATVLHPIGAGALMLLGGPAAIAFTMLHGAGNGMLTIAKGTLPLALFGPTGYGFRTGLLSAPARIAQAGAPLLFGMLLDRFGTGVLILSGGLGLASFVALLTLRTSRSTTPDSMEQIAVHNS
jgi:predicted MFS family arabinose efflux permease